jgi:YVTN family beta-propeller protein
VAGRLFVTNENGGDISVIDVATQKVVATIPVGKRPRGIRLSRDGSQVFVALSGSPIAPPGVDESTLPPPDKKADGIGIVSVKDLKLERVIRGGSDPEQLAVSSDGTHLFVANEDVGEANVINVEDGKVLATFKVGGEPEGVQLRPDGQVVYVTSEEDGQVAVIDAVNQKLLKTFKVGPRPRSTTFLPDSSRAFVTSENGGSVAFVDAKKHVVLKTITLSGPMFRPMGGVAAPDGKHVFITTGRGKNVVIIDTATQEPIARDRSRRSAVGYRRLGRRQDDLHREWSVERRHDRGRRQPHGEGKGQGWRSTMGRFVCSIVRAQRSKGKGQRAKVKGKRCLQLNDEWQRFSRCWCGYLSAARQRHSTALLMWQPCSSPSMAPSSAAIRQRR